MTATPSAEDLYLAWPGGIIVCRCGASYDSPADLAPAEDHHIAWWVSPEFPAELSGAPFLGACRSCGRAVFHHPVTECHSAYTKKTVQQRFAEFHESHPEVYEYILTLVSEVRTQGLGHYGIRPIWERLRWHFQIERGLGDSFKLNDNYPSRYVRMLIEDCPELRGFFELRRLKAP